MTLQNPIQLKLVMIDLDGCILSLNRYRYNFYKNTCKKKNISFAVEEFYESLGDMHTMYAHLPLSNSLDSRSLNQKIEKDLYNYLKIKGLKPRDGIIELFEYFHQKNIKIAVISTHKTRDAIAYLQLVSLYHHIDFVMGSDTELDNIPSPDIFEYLMNKYDVLSFETLCITSMRSFLETAAKCHIHSIYYCDLIEPREVEKSLSVKVAYTFFEVLNEIIFSRYEEYQMYAPILGINEDMNKETLNDVHDHLIELYQDDQQLLDIVDRTYEYHRSLLNQQERKQFVFSDDEEEDETIVPKPVNMTEEVEEEFQETPPITIDETEQLQDSHSSKTSLSLNQNDTKALSDIVQKIMIQENEEINDIENVLEKTKTLPLESKETIESETKSQGFLNGLINVVYSFVLSLMIILIGIVIYVAWIDWFHKGTLDVIANIYLGYESFCNTVIACVFNSLHALISSIPSYHDYLFNNSLFSMTGVHILNVYIINTLFIGVIQIVIAIIGRRKYVEKNTDD